MKAVDHVLGVCLLVALVGCSEGAAPVPTSVSSGTSRQAVADSASASERVELPVALESGEPLLVGAGGVLSSRFQVPKPGVVGAVGVQIGNFSGASDGELQVRLCQKERCAEGRANLQGSADNDFLMVMMDSPLQLTADAPAALTLTRLDGTGQFAVWTYPADESLTTPDGRTLLRSPRVALQYRS